MVTNIIGIVMIRKRMSTKPVPCLRPWSLSSNTGTNTASRTCVHTRGLSGSAVFTQKSTNYRYHMATVPAHSHKQKLWIQD